MVRAVGVDGKSESYARWSLLRVLAPARGATSDCSPQYYDCWNSSLSQLSTFTSYLAIPAIRTIYDLLSFTSQMELPPLTMEQLTPLVSSNAPSSQLFEALSLYEHEACLTSAGSGSPETSGSDPTLLSTFYSSFFLVHLLTDQVLVVKCYPIDCQPTNEDCATDLKLAP